jgi:hypothetical protein
MMRDGSFYGVMPGAPDAASAPLQYWQPPGRPRLDVGISPEPPLKVYLNHGRWIAECPDCHGAQLACWTDHRFLCNECGNVAVAGLWRAIIWPDDREAIETVLDQRSPVNQNWLPGETIEYLRAENAAHGVVR